MSPRGPALGVLAGMGCAVAGLVVVAVAAVMLSG